MKVNKQILNTYNKREIINLIRTKNPIFKAEISRMTGLSIPTVMKITDDFIKSGLVKVQGKGESSGGKRPELLEFVYDAYYIVGVDIGRNSIKTILMDLNANKLNSIVIKTEETKPEKMVIDKVIRSIETVINESNIDKNKILGIGVGMPGLLDIEKGIVLFSPDFNWEGVQLIQPIKEHFDLPIHIENSTRAIAMGEKWFGIGTIASNFLCVNLGHGIGSAIVMDGELYHGSSGSSGELGHITLEKDGPICECGNIGCLEALASANAITKTARNIILNGVDTLIISECNGNIEDVEAKTVFDAAKKGDEVAMKIIEEAINYIGIGLANYINLFDPDLIILAGGIVNAGDILLEGIKKVVLKRQMKFAARKLKIKVSNFGDDATAIGAASFLLKELIESGGQVIK